MRRLSGLDGMFLSVDQAETTHGTMAGLMIFEPSNDPGAGGREQVIQRITERLDAIPPLRWKHVSSKLGINNQHWVENPNLDVASHVHEVALPGDGSDHDLAAFAAQIQETSVDITQAPWEYYIIRGLQGDRIAHLIRLHHSAVDGATVPLVLDLLSDEPTTPAHPDDARSGSSPSIGAAPVAAARGVVDRLRTPVDLARIHVKTVKHLINQRGDDGALLALPSFVGRMVPGQIAPVVNKPLNALRRRRGKADVQPLVPKSASVPTPFNGTITSRRTYAFADLPLGEVKAAGKAFDATLNDAVVAVCAGAVRRFMADFGSVPEQPLVVCVPAALRSEESALRWANHVSMFFAEFPTHLADPAERIRAVHTELAAAKANFDATPTHLLRDVMAYVPQTFWNVSVKLMAHGPDWFPAGPWNVVISNVRGPAKTLRLCGREMAGYWPVAFLTPGIGLNITLQSYRDRINFGFIGCPDLTPDLWVLADYMTDALAELSAAAAHTAP
ncbi:MAG: wax ester/triacylglycerol synthase family O-acyltransferase [Tetrasphaera sp.]